MKKLIVVIIILIGISIPISVKAETKENLSEKEQIQIESLYKYITNMKSKYEILKDVDMKTFVKNFISSADGKINTTKFVKAISTYAVKEVIGTIKLMNMLIIISIVCALLSNIQNAFTDEKISNIAYFACYALIIIIITKSFYIGVEETRDVIKSMADFMAALIPVLLMLLASVGGFAEAAVMDPLIIAVINISTRVILDVVVPLITITVVLNFVNNISEDYKIGKLNKLLKQLVLWIQGIIMTIFIGTVTIRGITSKTLDQITVQTAKFAVDNFVPIVGGALSDAITTVAGYSVLLKNAISSVGLIVLIVIMVFPIIKILIMALIHKLTAALIEPVSDKRIVECISAVGDSLVLLASCVICVSVMFFIIISIIASAGKML